MTTTVDLDLVHKIVSEMRKANEYCRTLAIGQDKTAGAADHDQEEARHANDR